MPKQITTTTTVYKYSELSDAAKEKAQQEFYERYIMSDGSWYESVLDDAEEVAKVLGIEIEKKGSRLSIYFDTGRGDYATFEGSYTYVKGSTKALKEHAPLDSELHKIADRLQALQKKYFYGLYANISEYNRNRSLNVDVGHKTIDYFKYVESYDDVSEEMKDIFSDFCYWILKRLRAEQDFQGSEEYLIDGIEANELMFTEEGDIA